MCHIHEIHYQFIIIFVNFKGIKINSIQVYLPPMLISPLYKLKGVLNSTCRCSCVKRYIICNNGTHPVLNSLAKNEGVRGQKKWGKYFPVHSNHKSFKWLKTLLITLNTQKCKQTNNNQTATNSRRDILICNC